MYHAKTPSHNKDIKSMLDYNGVVQVVFCTVAPGVGVNFNGLNYILHYGFNGLDYILHYGTPTSIEDYYQECGRAKSVIYWTPADVPLRKNYK